MCRHVPPRNGSFSTTNVFSPNSPARIAATYPPGPLPIIATSYFATRCLPSAGARTDESSFSAPQSHSKSARGGQADKTGRWSFVYQRLSECPYLRTQFQSSALRTPSQTEKKPPALTAQTAASQQTSNFNSGTAHSQPDGGRGSGSVSGYGVYQELGHNFRIADITARYPYAQGRLCSAHGSLSKKQHGRAPKSVKTSAITAISGEIFGCWHSTQGNPVLSSDLSQRLRRASPLGRWTVSTFHSLLLCRRVTCAESGSDEISCCGRLSLRRMPNSFNSQRYATV
jgi:hypothetical protein